jgi:hypothetical protein
MIESEVTIQEIAELLGSGFECLPSGRLRPGPVFLPVQGRPRPNEVKDIRYQDLALVLSDEHHREKLAEVARLGLRSAHHSLVTPEHKNHAALLREELAAWERIAERAASAIRALREDLQPRDLEGVRE